MDPRSDENKTLSGIFEGHSHKHSHKQRREIVEKKKPDWERLRNT